MYESFFQLQSRPFSAAPQAGTYFAAPGIETARTTLARCIERAEGTGFLAGPAGTGKTLLCRVLAEQFKDQFQVALLTNGHVSTRRALLQAILFELGLPYRELQEGELRLSLIDHLVRGAGCPGGMLLLIDEAHALPLRLLEEIRMMTNLLRRGLPCVRLVLAGGPSLEERFASPRLESFSQRLAARCYLGPWARGEVYEYVRYQVNLAGGRPEGIFGDDALEAVYRATDGVPRLVNQVCDHALLLAYSDGRQRLDAEVIEAAWADLQQLPTPYGTAGQLAAVRAPQAVLEFGGLEDDEQGEDLAETGCPSDVYDTTGIDEGNSDSAIVRAEDVAAWGENWQSHDLLPDQGCVGQDSSVGGGYYAEQEEAVRDPWATMETNAAAPNDAFGQEVYQATTADPCNLFDLYEAAARPGTTDALEEEVVVDPYAALDAQKPGESSPPDLANTHASTAEHATAPGDNVSFQDDRQPVTTGAMEAMLTLAEALLLEETGARAVLPNSRAFQVVSADDFPPPSADRTQMDSAAPDAQPEVGEPGAEFQCDDDLIIVDAPRNEPAAPPASPPAAVRRQEYRQLFARLRKG